MIVLMALAVSMVDVVESCDVYEPPENRRKEPLRLEAEMRLVMLRRREDRMVYIV